MVAYNLRFKINHLKLNTKYIMGRGWSFKPLLYIFSSINPLNKCYVVKTVSIVSLLRTIKFTVIIRLQLICSLDNCSLNSLKTEGQRVCELKGFVKK